MASKTKNLTDKVLTSGGPLCALMFYIMAIYLSAGTIISSIVEYDKHFPNPRFHMSPARAYAYIAIASPILIYSALRFRVYLLRLWRVWKGDPISDWPSAQKSSD